jgi:hypothetical protein
MALLTPIVAIEGSVTFDEMLFAADRGFEHIPGDQRWLAMFRSVPASISANYIDDFYSNKMSPMYARYIKNNEDTLSEHLMVCAVIRQKPREVGQA